MCFHLHYCKNTRVFELCLKFNPNRAYITLVWGLVSTPIDAAIRRSHRELFRDTAGLTIGMNWIRSFDDELAQNIIWHNGGTGGFRTYLGFTEDRQFGVFVLGNTANSVDALAVEILKSLVREHATEAENRLQTMAVPK
jgi:hypothetical protein